MGVVHVTRTDRTRRKPPKVLIYGVWEVFVFPSRTSLNGGSKVFDMNMITKETRVTKVPVGVVYLT